MSGGRGDEQHCLIPNSREACGGLSHVSDSSASLLLKSTDLFGICCHSLTKYSSIYLLGPVSTLFGEERKGLWALISWV